MKDRSLKIELLLSYSIAQRKRSTDLIVTCACMCIVCLGDGEVCKFESFVDADKQKPINGSRADALLLKHPAEKDIRNQLTMTCMHVSYMQEKSTYYDVQLLRQPAKNEKRKLVSGTSGSDADSSEGSSSLYSSQNTIPASTGSSSLDSFPRCDGCPLFYYARALLFARLCRFCSACFP